jgi:hypothetical protein
MKIASKDWRAEYLLAAKVTSLSLRLASSAGNPLANTIPGCEANDQSNYNFHWRLCPQQPDQRASSGWRTY